MIGHVLSGNTSTYSILGSVTSTWEIQAQYFWQDENGIAYAQTGNIVNVNPGDVLTTTIAYDSQSGSINASIGATSGTSAIIIERPFPNEVTPQFRTWSDFFEQALTKSGQILGVPEYQVESHYVDEATICSILPTSIQSINIQGTKLPKQNFNVGNALLITGTS